MSQLSKCIDKTITVITASQLYGATSIRNYAFYGCTGLTTMTIPSSVTSIGDYAFYGCTGLTSVTFGENSQLTDIGNSAFEGCTSLTSITIPSSVTSIGRVAFGGTTTSSSKRLRINFLSSTPATVYAYSTFKGGTFTRTTASAIIYADVHIPVGTEASYRANTVWNTFFNSSNVTVTADL